MAPRSSRKRRKQRQRAARETAAPAAAAAAKPSVEEEQPRGYARARAKDEQARAALVPLESGERPTAVTVGAIVAFVFGIANLGSYVAGLEVQGTRPSFIGVAVYSALMFVAAWGMWRARYWAVLGMQALLGLIIVIFGVLAIKFEDALDLVVALAVLTAAGSLFWFLVKAMARIQMPERPGAR